MRMIELSDKQLEVIRRAMLTDAVEDMEWAADAVDHLATVAPWPVNGSADADARNAVDVLREGLDALDALGWPDQDVVTTPGDR
jgi:hypothetical protein